MTRRRVLVIGADGQEYDALSRLEAVGMDVVPRLDLHDKAREEDVIAALDGVWGVIAGNEPYSERVLDAATGLRVIARPGVGYDAVAVEAATRRGVVVFTTPGINQETVADFTILLMLACMRQLPLLDRLVRAGDWQPEGSAPELNGATVGIVGLGAVGRVVVQRLLGFDCTILATEPKPDLAFCDQFGIKLMSFQDLLPKSDVLSLHVPLNQETFHMLGRTELARMKPTAVVINTARGPIIDETALVAALRAGTIGSAGLDVFETEPLPQGHPLTKLSNVVLTGHVASHTKQTMRRMLDAAVQGVLDVAGGRIPSGCLNPEAMGVRDDR